MLTAQRSQPRAQSTEHQLPTKTIRPKPQLNAQWSQPNAHSPMLTAQSTERQLPTKNLRPKPQLNALSAEPNAHSSKLTAQSTERQPTTKNQTHNTTTQRKNHDDEN